MQSFSAREDETARNLGFDTTGETQLRMALNNAAAKKKEVEALTKDIETKLKRVGEFGVEIARSLAR